MPGPGSATAVRRATTCSGEPSRSRFPRFGPIALTLALATAVAVLTPAVAAHAATPTCHGVKATLVVVASASQPVHGTPGRDVIVGTFGNDIIYAGGGNDLVCGGDGADELYGGRGDDTIYGQRDALRLGDEDALERVGDTLRGGPGDDRLDGGLDTRPVDIAFYDVYAWDQSAHGVHIDLRTGTARGEGDDTIATGTYSILGSPHADVVDGTNRRDHIETGAGPDIVRGRGGNDSIGVDGRLNGAGSDADHVSGGPGNDWISSRHGEDHLSGNDGDDRIETVGISNDVLRGGPGDDYFWSEIGDTTGPQVFDGGPGNDGIQIHTDEINPTYAASTGTYTMATGSMTFTLEHRISLSVHVEAAILGTRGTHWTVTGTPGDDAITAVMEAAGATFHGLAGNDTFQGSDHDDTFDGGPGADTATMGDGDDTCIRVEVIHEGDCQHIS